MLDNFPDNFRRNDEEVLNEFRQKQINFDLEERKNEVNNSRSLFVGALAGLAMAGIVGWFILAPSYQSDDPENVPVIARPQMPVKIQPSDPGDIELASQERTVYDIIEKKPVEEEQEKVASSPEEPDAKGIEQLVEEAKVEVAGVGDVESLTTKEKPAAAPRKEVEKVASKAEVKVEQEKPAEAVKTPTPATIAKGSWVVQLMSSPNKPAVEKAWGTMTKKYSMLNNLPYEVESADLGARGTFYRLKAGSFASKESALEFCNKLKAAGGSCIVAKK